MCSWNGSEAASRTQRGGLGSCKANWNALPRYSPVQPSPAQPSPGKGREMLGGGKGARVSISVRKWSSVLVLLVGEQVEREVQKCLAMMQEAEAAVSTPFPSPPSQTCGHHPTIRPPSVCADREAQGGVQVGQGLPSPDRSKRGDHGAAGSQSGASQTPGYGFDANPEPQTLNPKP